MQYNNWEGGKAAGHLYSPRNDSHRYSSVLNPLVVVDTYLLLYSPLVSSSSSAATAAHCCTVPPRILIHLNLFSPRIRLHFSCGDLCFVCMNQPDPAQHCITLHKSKRSSWLSCQHDFTLRNPTTHDTAPLPSDRPSSLTSSPHINYYFCLSPPSLQYSISTLDDPFSLSLSFRTYAPVIRLTPPFTTQ